MRFWKRKMPNNSMRAFVLVFALQAIAAIGLCAIHDLASTPTTISDGVSPAWPSQVGEAGLTPQLIGFFSDHSRHEDNELDHCEEPVLLAAGARLAAPDSSSMVFEMAPAWQQATLQPLSSRRALPPRWVSLTRPPPQILPLDIAPRMRI